MNGQPLMLESIRATLAAFKALPPCPVRIECSPTAYHRIQRAIQRATQSLEKMSSVDFDNICGLRFEFNSEVPCPLYDVVMSDGSKRQKEAR
jgi:hypothetical protein